MDVAGLCGQRGHASEGLTLLLTVYQCTALAGGSF